MTTASCQSLAHAIVFGRTTEEDTGSENDSDPVGDAPLMAQRRIRRKPSVFASPPEDHFPPATHSGERTVTELRGQ